MSKSTSDPQRIKRILNFLSLGYSDYIAARNLLLSGLPLQGAILGSTAVEKYIKAILAVRGENAGGHLKKSHIKSLNNYLPELSQKTNPEFLEFLQKCYQLRYTDNLQPNFNIAIYARETLAELDETIFNLEFQLNFRESNNTKILTRYQSALNSKNFRLITENYILLGEDKNHFLSKPDLAFSMRNRLNEGILEIDFKVKSSPLDGNFCREGLLEVDREKRIYKIIPDINDSQSYNEFDEEIVAISLSAGCDQNGQFLLIKLLSDNEKSHCILMPSTIAIWYARNRKELEFGPYEVPSQPNISPEDWDGSKSLVMADMKAMQNGDELTFTSTIRDGRTIKINLPPPCHALLGIYVNECLPLLVDQ